MTTGQQGQTKQGNRKVRPRQARSLAAHPTFAPMLGIWGAALAGLSIMVLPAPIMVRASKGTGLVLLGGQAQLVIAILAAVLLGASLFIIASQLHRKACRRDDAPSIVSLATRRVLTIDPARELGSLRLDDPVEIAPFAAAPKPASPATPDEPTPTAPAEELPVPRALNLAEFAIMPGRNGPWVVEPAASVAAELAPLSANQPTLLTAVAAKPEPSPEAPVADVGNAALARLRATPPQELSLVQMVERFAGALHEYREAALGHVSAPRDLAAREAALAEALRALAALSGESTAASTPSGEPLRETLSRLQGLRGAA